MRNMENVKWEYGKCGVWKMGSMENESMENGEYGKWGVWKMRAWKMRSMENAGWKMRSMISHRTL